MVKCGEKQLAAWSKLEAAAVSAGTVCPSVLDQAPIEDFVDACVASIAVAVGGGALPLDVATCNSDLTTCDDALAICDPALAACEVAPAAQALKTGQTLCHNTAGAVLACAGTGHDGDLQKGVARNFTD